MTSMLDPEALRQIGRLDLRAAMAVRGFLQGLHRSPLQGFSVQFSEHQKYTPGDDPKQIDWLAYAKTDRYYVKRYEAETNLSGYLAIDLSASMGVRSGPVAVGSDASTDRTATKPTATKQTAANRRGSADSSSMTKFEYATSLAAALTYLMTMQQDPVGLLAISDRLRAILPARSRRDHLGDVIASLSKMRPSGQADWDVCVSQMSAMLKTESLLMIFSDLLPASQASDASVSPEKVIGEFAAAMAKLRHGGHDVIVFHVLDRREATFDFVGPVAFEDAETGRSITVDADGFREQYLSSLNEYRRGLNDTLSSLKVDYVPLDTGMAFDTALAEYLIGRSGRL